MSEADLSLRGEVNWHSSDEDSGPDLGMSVGIGNGKWLYVGEISRDLHDEGGEEAAALGDDMGWWLVLYPEQIVMGRFVGQTEAQTFVDNLSRGFGR